MCENKSKYFIHTCVLYDVISIWLEGRSPSGRKIRWGTATRIEISVLKYGWNVDMYIHVECIDVERVILQNYLSPQIAYGNVEAKKKERRKGNDEERRGESETSVVCNPKWIFYLKSSIHFLLQYVLALHYRRTDYTRILSLRSTWKNGKPNSNVQGAT